MISHCAAEKTYPPVRWLTRWRRSEWCTPQNNEIHFNPQRNPLQMTFILMLLHYLRTQLSRFARFISIFFLFVGWNKSYKTFPFYPSQSRASTKRKGRPTDLEMFVLAIGKYFITFENGLPKRNEFDRLQQCEYRSISIRYAVYGCGIGTQCIRPMNHILKWMMFEETKDKITVSHIIHNITMVKANWTFGKSENVFHRYGVLCDSLVIFFYVVPRKSNVAFNSQICLYAVFCVLR